MRAVTIGDLQKGKLRPSFYSDKSGVSFSRVGVTPLDLLVPLLRETLTDPPLIGYVAIEVSKLRSVALKNKDILECELRSDPCPVLREYRYLNYLTIDDWTGCECEFNASQKYCVVLKLGTNRPCHRNEAHALALFSCKDGDGQMKNHLTNSRSLWLRDSLRSHETWVDLDDDSLGHS